MSRIPFVFVVALAMTTMALAHNGVEHIRGTVKAITTDSITVTTTTNQTVTIAFDAQTKFHKSGVAADAKDLKTGERVVVNVHEMDGKNHAISVQFGAPPKAAPSTATDGGHH